MSERYMGTTDVDLSESIMTMCPTTKKSGPIARISLLAALVTLEELQRDKIMSCRSIIIASLRRWSAYTRLCTLYAPCYNNAIDSIQVWVRPSSQGRLRRQIIKEVSPGLPVEKLKFLNSRAMR